MYRHKYEKYRAQYLDMRGGMTVLDIEKIINKKFQKIFKGISNPKDHLFFDSHEWWLRTLKEWDEDNIRYRSLNIKAKPIKDCKYVPKKVISKELLKELYAGITDDSVDDFETIRGIVDQMLDYNLPSTVGPEHLKKKFRVVIAGAGPIGLFTALYLDKQYNHNGWEDRMEIILLDNRISDEGYKLPYSRTTQFGFDIDQFQPFIERIFCWHGKTISFTRQFDYIYLLENLLYLHAYNTGLPMYFTKKYDTYDKLKELDCDIILDCTGGRLNPILKPDIEWSGLNFKKGEYEIKGSNENFYSFFINGNKYEHKTLILYLLDKNFKPLPVGNQFMFVKKEDYHLADKHNGKCYRKDNIIDNFKEYYDLAVRGRDKDVEYLKVSVFNTNPHHVNRVAQFMDGKLYIGLGDTLGHSEYGIYFGMKDGILFSKYVCHLLGLFD